MLFQTTYLARSSQKEISLGNFKTVISLQHYLKSFGNIILNFIQPGKPQQNAYIERYNRTVRYDWLGHYLFYSLSELQEYATQWQWFYNHERPNMALNGFTPMQHIQRLSDSTYLPG